MNFCGFPTRWLVLAFYGCVLVCALSISSSARADLSMPGARLNHQVDLYAAAISGAEFTFKSSSDNRGMGAGPAAAAAHERDPIETAPLGFRQAILDACSAAILSLSGRGAGGVGGNSSNSYGSDTASPANTMPMQPLDNSKAGARFKLENDAFRANPAPIDLLKPPRMA